MPLAVRWSPAVLLGLIAVPLASGIAQAQAGPTTTPELVEKQVDASFGKSGRVLTAVGTGAQGTGARAQARLQDGRLVVAGVADDGGHKLVLARYQSNGALDTSFGAGEPHPGVIVAGFGDGGTTEGEALLRRENGSVVVAGDTVDGGVAKVFLAAFTPDGALAPGFGAATGVTLLALGDDAAVRALARDPENGSLFVAGSAGVGDTRRAFVAKFTPDGDVDPSFQGAGAPPGVAYLDLIAQGGRANGLDVTVGGDHMPVLTGFRHDIAADRDDVLLARFAAAGAPDPAFGNGGLAVAIMDGAGRAIARHPLPPPQSTSVGLLIDSYVVAGNAGKRAMVARFDHSGALDTHYGSTGMTAIDPGSAGGAALASAVVVAEDGSYTLAGSALDGSVRRVLAARIDSDGTPSNALTLDLPGAGVVLAGAGDGGDAAATGAVTHARGHLLTVAGHAQDGGVTKLALVQFGKHFAPTAKLDVAYDTHGQPGRAVRPGQPLTLDPAASADLDGRVTKYEYDLDGDAAYESSSDEPGKRQHVYPADALYATEPSARLLRLRVTDDEGMTDSSTVAVSVGPNRVPVALLGEDGCCRTATGGSEMRVGAVGVSTEIPARASYDPDGKVVRYRWDLDNDGSFERDTGGTPSVVTKFNKPGIARVGLQVTDDEGAIAKGKFKLDVKNRTKRYATESGRLRGKVEGQTYAFRGIPFAKAPTGDRRWKVPEKLGASARKRKRDAFEYGAKCVQSDASGSENCLFLNVWTPAKKASPRAVMVFFHGGAFVDGSTDETWYGQDRYSGRAISELGDVLVVTAQYRLGVFGYLAADPLDAEDEVSGNYGLIDQIRALRWVKSNIRKFGGDASRVMIFGQSAGAGSVCSLVGSPAAAGLFSRALVESGADACKGATRASVDKKGTKFLKAVGCNGGSSRKQRACLRATKKSKLVMSDVSWGPIAGGHGLQVGAPLDRITAGRHNKVHLIVGNTTEEYNSKLLADDEYPDGKVTGDYAKAITTGQYKVLSGGGTDPLYLANAIVLYPPVGGPSGVFKALSQLLSDQRYVCPGRQLARAMALHTPTRNVYRYSWDHRFAGTGTSNDAKGTSHAIELPFVFNNVNPKGFKFTGGEVALSELTIRYWTRFAKTGDPNAKAGDPHASDPAWPTYFSSPGEPTLRIRGEGSTVVTSLKELECDFWDVAAPS